MWLEDGSATSGGEKSTSFFYRSMTFCLSAYGCLQREPTDLMGGMRCGTMDTTLSLAVGSVTILILVCAKWLDKHPLARRGS